jgi:hypothetical protein
LTLVFKTVRIGPKQKSQAEVLANTKQPNEIITAKGVYMREKKFIRTLSCLCVVILASGTAFAQQGKIRSGPYKGPMAPMTTPEAPDVVFLVTYRWTPVPVATTAARTVT